MAIRTNNENLVLILSRYQLTMGNEDKPLEDIGIKDIWPVLNIAAANADVVIIKEGKQFKVLKHKHMNGLINKSLKSTYHESSLKNICFARCFKNGEGYLGS
jgi:hypothetical protein